MKIPNKLNYSIWFKLVLFIPLFLIIFLLMLKYEAICNFGAILKHPVSLKTFIDAWIPFNFYIVYTYIICLLYVPFSGILYAFNHKISAVQSFAFYLSSIFVYLITYTIYLVFPTTAQEVMISSFNPQILNEGSFKILQSIYTSSTPLGDFPSLHVAPLVFMGFFLHKYWRLLFWIFLPFAFLGAIGTVLLKFHTFLGLFGGVIMGIFAYYYIYEKTVLKLLSRLIQEK